MKENVEKNFLLKKLEKITAAVEDKSLHGVIVLN